MKKNLKQSHVALNVVVLRLLGLGFALFVFIWQNIFYILVPPNASLNKLLVFSSSIGLLYGLMLCGTFFPMSNGLFRRVYQSVFMVLSIGVAIFVGISILSSIIFINTETQFVVFQTINILMLTVVIANTKIVLRNVDIFVHKKKIFFGVLFIYLMGLIALTVRWNYLTEPIACNGRSMTTAGDIEPWSYTLARFHCWKYKLWSVE